MDVMLDGGKAMTWLPVTDTDWFFVVENVAETEAQLGSMNVAMMADPPEVS